MSDCHREEPVVPVDRTAVRRAAMDLLARREHSLRELQQKLRRRFPDQQTVAVELERLVQENLQSDERFAASFARQRASRGCGPVRIRQEMRDRGLSDAAIDAALEQAELDWCRLADTVFRKKFGEPVTVEIREKARRARFMQYRGFGPDHYQHLIDR